MARDWLSLSYTDNLLLRFDFCPQIGMFGSSTLVCGVQCAAATLLQTCCAVRYVNLSWKCSEERKGEQTQKAVCSYGRGKYMKGFCKLWPDSKNSSTGARFAVCLLDLVLYSAWSLEIPYQCWRSSYLMNVTGVKTLTALVGHISFLGAAVELQHLPECCCSAIKSSPLWCNQ